MDGGTFDRVVRLVGARGTRRGLVAALAAAGLGSAGFAGEALACKQARAACDPEQARLCCSGVCHRCRRRHACAPVPDDAFGCTTNPATDGCAGKLAVCPSNENGNCGVDGNGRPFCAVAFECVFCATDADCATRFAGGGIAASSNAATAGTSAEGRRPASCRRAEAP